MQLIALVYQDENNKIHLDSVNCSDNSVMYNNDFNWEQEVPSRPSKDAVDRIWDRVKDKIAKYNENEISDFYKNLKNNNTKITITVENVKLIYEQWKANVSFIEKIEDEQQIIDLFFVDVLNNTKYKKKINIEIFGGNFIEEDVVLITEGTNLAKYQIVENNGMVECIKYVGNNKPEYFTFADKDIHNDFWKKYKRPPEEEQFKLILENKHTMYSQKYRETTGAEYTPSCFVELQNKILSEHYNMNEYLVFDPCAGVGNLENQFGKDFKENCYLSTLEQSDVDICLMKGFDNSIQFDYLASDEEPIFKYGGNKQLTISEIAKLEHKKLMVIMNPPYKKHKDFNNNLAIEFFNKAIKLNPDVIVLYYMTKNALTSERTFYANSGYYVCSHVMSNAKDTFKLQNWGVSQIIFDKNPEHTYDWNHPQIKRYEVNSNDKLEYVTTHIYDNEKSSLIKSIDQEIKNHAIGTNLGSYSYLSDTIFLGDVITNNSNKITTNNLKYCLLSKGLNFNTDAYYYELNKDVLKGTIDDLTEELISDSIMFSLFYKKNTFTNKNKNNYIMPFTHTELGCSKNDLNIMKATDLLGSDFDFRVFMRQFTFSKEALDLYTKALTLFKYYHSNPNYTNKNWNDSFYDITNAIMSKSYESYKKKENDSRRGIKTKTTKGTVGFSERNYKSRVSEKDHKIFNDFFKARNILAEKINQQLVDAGILLWKRANIF